MQPIPRTSGTPKGSRNTGEFLSATRCERTGEGRKRAMANGVKFGRKPKLSEYQRKEALRRRAAGETLGILQAD
jgi:hypothetical protein